MERGCRPVVLRRDWSTHRLVHSSDPPFSSTGPLIHWSTHPPFSSTTYSACLPACLRARARACVLVCSTCTASTSSWTQTRWRCAAACSVRGSRRGASRILAPSASRVSSAPPPCAPAARWALLRPSPHLHPLPHYIPCPTFAPCPTAPLAPLSLLSHLHPLPYLHPAFASDEWLLTPLDCHVCSSQHF